MVRKIIYALPAVLLGIGLTLRYIPESYWTNPWTNQNSPTEEVGVNPNALWVKSPGSKFDAGEHTRRALEGLQELLQSLEEGVPVSEGTKAEIIHLAVLQSYLALKTQELSPKDAEECRALALDLFKMIQDKTDNPPKGI